MSGDSLYLRYGLNDLIRNRGVNLALTVILVFSAFLMTTGAMVMERLLGSMNQLFSQAKPPHFLQMHKGEYDQKALKQFAAAHPEIDSWLIEKMLGYDSAALAWERPTTGETGDFSRSLIDNLFVTQTQDFDFLMDEQGGIPRPAPGEVYLPVAYQQKFKLQAGDELNIRTDGGPFNLHVRGFVRDSQMASSMSSATRLLISEADFTRLAQAGGNAPEIIVEYRLHDPAQVSAFQRAYESNNVLPKNGQAVTYQMIRMINAFSDGLVAVALVFVSLLLIAIALLNLRFVIQGTLEDEVRQIGVMKAIGLPDSAIRNLYLSKYSVMTLLACVLGGLLAVFATGLLTRSIQVNYAAAPLGLSSFLVPLIALLVVYLFVIGICRSVLGGIRRMQVVSALVQGSTLNEKQTARRAKQAAHQARHTNLAAFQGGNLNSRLALLDLRAESGQWVLIPIVFFLAAMLMTLPINLFSTFNSPRFITYMGAPQSDLRADLQFSQNVDSLRQDVLNAMQSDPRLKDVRVFANVLEQAQGPEGWETLHVEVGDYASGTVSFLKGQPPKQGEIALSVLNARKYQLATGDQLTVRRGANTSPLTVSGIYQDVTSGGYTAKMQGEVTQGAARYTIYANTVNGANPALIAAEYRQRFPAAAVIPMHEYVQQTLAYVTSAFRSAAVLAFLFGIGVALLITSLFLKLRLTRERRKMGVLSAIGFSSGEIIAQARGKTLLAMVTGTLLGLLFAATAGEKLVGSLISLAGLGVAQLKFISSPLLVYVACPLLLIAAGYLGAVLLTAPLRHAEKSQWLRA